MKNLPRLSSLICVVIMLGCAGSGDKDDTPKRPGETGESQKPVSSTQTEAERQLENMNRAACELFCPRATRCAVEDARAKLSPEKFAELNVEKMTPIHTRKCLEECINDRLSPRQVQVIGTCAQDTTTTCREFIECASASKPKPTAK